ncbi:hypothetical protein XSR1_230023 [Xenorhabdus szentirmaii DSM 16338]|uniref:Uncharacterized protein n=1 Tax=Xenorhabdus szentirmaii DSM 16338 TaxID=1427518 RepID=W1IW33_9GAMM|nr:hypothetical protein XSR1_230023 [Xenorhabdus szentirmaii DSM 16338]
MRLVSFIKDGFNIIVGVSNPRVHFTTIRGIACYVDEKSQIFNVTSLPVN